MSVLYSYFLTAVSRRSLASPLLLLFLFTFSTDLTAQTGTSILRENLYDQIGSAGATAKVLPITIEGQTFTNGYCITVNGSSAKIEDSILQWPTTQNIDYGDNLQITFWVRKIAPSDGKNLRAFISFEKVIVSGSKPLFTTFPCDTGEWMKYSFTFKAPEYYAAGEARLAFQFAHGPQVFEIGGISAVNLGQTPAPSNSGIPVLTNKVSQDFVPYIDPKVGGSITPVAASGPGFTQALHIATNGNSEYNYLSGLILYNLTTVKKGDLMLLSFWARKIEPANDVIKAQVVFERNGGNFEKSLGINFPNDTAEWKQYRVPFRSSNDFFPGEARLIFQFGYGPQRFELGDIKLDNYGSDATPDQLSLAYYYPGRGEANAAWRAAANNRIDQFRKGNLTVTVRDLLGNPIPGATVYVQQTRHAFKFGSAVTAQRLAGGEESDAERVAYRARVSSHFNSAVLENDLKWTFWEAWAMSNRRPTLDALAWLTGQKMTVRGHNLIWPSESNMPPDIRGMPPADLRTRIDNHFAEILSPENTGGKCSQWDVINEPYSNYYVQGLIPGVGGVTPSNGMLGNLEMVRWLQNARRLDPQAQLYVNDYDVIESGGADVRHQDYLFRLVNWLRDNGAPLDGIGLQGHFDRITPPTILQSIIERFSQLPVALAITEFDINVLDEQLQADYTRDVMTLIFSSPKFNDFLLWGFWENSHWRPDAAMYRADWSSKPNALVFNDLVSREWWTSETGTSDATGKYTVRGFKGDYKVTVIYQYLSQTETVTIDPNGELVVKLNVYSARTPYRRPPGRPIAR